MKRIYFATLIFIFIVFTYLSSIEQSTDILDLEILDYTKLQNQTSILSYTFRFFGEKLSTDFALIFPMEEELFIFPYIDFVYKF